MNEQSRFVAYEASEARAAAPVPLLIGLVGPSGSGKTYSALRIATGIQEIVGGDIFVVDTEQRRALHYADKFSFQHVNFQAPFGSLDYLEALRFCKANGAGVVVIDSCSHEHDGPGGLLEQHEAELDRLAGNDYKKRDRMQMLAWQKPKGGRRKLINAITTELAMPVIFCFRAKKTTKPKPGSQPIDMGFTSIGADEWMFEMALNALLLPGSNGVPTWQSTLPGEKLAIKLPEQFRAIAERGGPLNEAIGRSLAKWAKGDSGDAPARPAKREFKAEEVGEPEQSDDWGDDEPNPGDNPPDWQADAERIRDMIEAADGRKSWEEAKAAYAGVSGSFPMDVITDLDARLSARREALKSAA